MDNERKRALHWLDNALDETLAYNSTEVIKTIRAALQPTSPMGDEVIAEYHRQHDLLRT